MRKPAELKKKPINIKRSLFSFLLIEKSMIYTTPIIRCGKTEGVKILSCRQGYSLSYLFGVTINLIALQESFEGSMSPVLTGNRSINVKKLLKLT